MFRKGVLGVLRDAGIDAETPDDVLAWVRDEQRKLVLLSICHAGDWTLLEHLHHAADGVLVIAVLDDMSTDNALRALQAGAAAILPRDASPQMVREASIAAVEGRSILPVAVVRALTTLPVARQDPGIPSLAEQEWLAHLAGGMTIAQLATRAGYSERMMFRLLRDLYTRLGVSNRTEALLRARDAGWLR